MDKTYINYHVCSNINGLLELSDEELDKMFEFDPENDEGTKGIREHLEELKKVGYNFIPIGECDNFDKVYGCLGHLSEVDIPESDPEYLN